MCACLYVCRRATIGWRQAIVEPALATEQWSRKTRPVAAAAGVTTKEHVFAYASHDFESEKLVFPISFMYSTPRPIDLFLTFSPLSCTRGYMQECKENMQGIKFHLDSFSFWHRSLKTGLCLLWGTAGRASTHHTSSLALVKTSFILLPCKISQP